MFNCMCVYQILNVKNGNRYVGGTTQFYQRKIQHRSDLRLGKHGNPKLQADYQKYDSETFKFSMLEIIKDGSLLRDAEQKWIEFLHPEYNITDNNNPFSSTFLGRVQSKSTREKRKQSLKKFYQTSVGKKIRKKMGERWMGDNNPTHNLSSERRIEKAKIANKARTDAGYKHSKVTKSRMSKSAEKEWVGAIDPDGNTYSPIIGLKKFSEKYSLSYTCMYDLMVGRQKTHKGWIRYEK